VDAAAGALARRIRNRNSNGSIDGGDGLALEEQRKQYETLIAQDYRSKYNVSQSQYAGARAGDRRRRERPDRRSASASHSPGLRAPAGSVARA
jgi:hypothetical protein